MYTGAPFAAFLHFIDSHEDSLAVAAILDAPLTAFLEHVLESADARGTVLLVISDHGLHYGPYFQTEAGRRERAEPVLSIRLPASVRQRGTALVPGNARLRVTPFDVHATLSELFDTPRARAALGSSLLHPLAPVRSCSESGIPAELCGDTMPPPEQRQPCQPLPRVPSSAASIASGRRPRAEGCACFGR